MFLCPQHFQQWDRFNHSALQFRMESVAGFCWGVTELEINRGGLLNGQFSLVKCSGIFPGGTIFSVSEVDGSAPSAAIVSVKDPSIRTVDVYLTLPADRPSLQDVSSGEASGGSLTRFVRVEIKVADENTGNNERQVTVARPNLQLVLGEDAVGSSECIQIARLKQESAGVFALDESYVAPSLHLSASPALIGVIRRLLETLHSKSTSLSESRSQRAAGALEYGGGDVGSLWLLDTVNTAIPVINHYYRNRQTHPESAFLTLAQLAGALLTFSPSLHPRDLPHYDHSDLARTYFEIERTIQNSLKAMVPTGAVEILLEHESDSKFSARIAEEQSLLSSQVFLAAKADIPESQLIDELPRQAKISSADTINSLLGLALPGVALVHCPIPPHPLRVKLGLQYFRFENRRDAESQKHWELICKSRTVAIRIPGQRFPGLKMEMWSIKE